MFHVKELINPICNMLGNMLNDLAEAIRRWKEKKLMFHGNPDIWK